MTSPPPLIQPRTVFITGCSSGLGRSIALAAQARGDQVVATARDPSALADIVAAAPDSVLALRLDVTRMDEVGAAIDQTIARFGRLDILVNNAGFGMMGTVEEVSDAEARRVFDANYFGPLSLIRTALPHMRRQSSGHVVNIASIGGLRGRAGSGIYSSAKFALVGLSEALAEEVCGFGIGVTVVLPGGIRTDFAGRSLAWSQALDAYAQTPAGLRRGEIAQRNGTQPGCPDAMARCILTTLDDPHPPLWLVLGEVALECARKKCASLAEALDRWTDASLSVDVSAPPK